MIDALEGFTFKRGLGKLRGLYAFSPSGLGFALGGEVLGAPSTDLASTDLASGLVIYNDSSTQWYNVSTACFTYNGRAAEGAALFVPIYGPEGLLFAFGGFSGDEQYVSFTEAYIFEPQSGQWAQQSVSGDIPNATADPCVVGLEGDEGTYEVCTSITLQLSAESEQD